MRIHTDDIFIRRRLMQGCTYIWEWGQDTKRPEFYAKDTAIYIDKAHTALNIFHFAVFFIIESFFTIKAEMFARNKIFITRPIFKISLEKILYGY